MPRRMNQPPTPPPPILGSTSTSCTLQYRAKLNGLASLASLASLACIHLTTASIQACQCWRPAM